MGHICLFFLSTFQLRFIFHIPVLSCRQQIVQQLQRLLRVLPQQLVPGMRMMATMIRKERRKRMTQRKSSPIQGTVLTWTTIDGFRYSLPDCYSFLSLKRQVYSRNPTPTDCRVFDAYSIDLGPRCLPSAISVMLHFEFVSLGDSPWCH